MDKKKKKNQSVKFGGWGGGIQSGGITLGGVVPEISAALYCLDLGNSDEDCG